MLFSETVNERAALPCSLMMFFLLYIDKSMCLMNLFSSGQQLSSPFEEVFFEEVELVEFH